MIKTITIIILLFVCCSFAKEKYTPDYEARALQANGWKIYHQERGNTTRALDYSKKEHRAKVMEYQTRRNLEYRYGS